VAVVSVIVKKVLITMKRASAKAKGKKLEVLTGKLLGNWWWGQPFPRSHGSGSSLTYCADDTVIAGDLHTTKDFPFCVECKNQEQWSLDAVFAGTCKKVAGWWAQTLRESGIANKIPMLVATRNSYPIYMIMRRYNIGWNWDSMLLDMDRCFFLLGEESLVLVKLEEFAKYVLVERVKGYISGAKEESQYMSNKQTGE